MEAALREVEHVPPKGTDLTGSEPMAVGDQDHGPVAVRGACAYALLRGGDEAVDLFRGEVLAGAPLGIGKAPRRNFPIYSAWATVFRHPFRLGFHRPSIHDFPIH